MKDCFRFFLRDEHGAVTVDWVVLTAGVVGLAVGVILIMNDGPMNVGTAIGGAIGSMSIDTSN
jgi:Flp pilus assembly pilin Flp